MLKTTMKKEWTKKGRKDCDVNMQINADINVKMY